MVHVVDFNNRTRKLKAARRRRRIAISAIVLALAFFVSALGVVAVKTVDVMLDCLASQANDEFVSLPDTPVTVPSDVVTIVIQDGDTVWGRVAALQPGYDPRNTASELLVLGRVAWLEARLGDLSIVHGGDAFQFSVSRGWAAVSYTTPDGPAAVEAFPEYEEYDTVRAEVALRGDSDSSSLFCGNG